MNPSVAIFQLLKEHDDLKAENAKLRAENARLEGLLRSDTSANPTAKVCANCGQPAEGNYSIHRDGFDEGPEVPLCDACGGETHPTLAEIWQKISHKQP